MPGPLSILMRDPWDKLNMPLSGVGQISVRCGEIQHPHGTALKSFNHQHEGLARTPLSVHSVSDKASSLLKDRLEELACGKDPD